VNRIKVNIYHYFLEVTAWETAVPSADSYYGDHRRRVAMTGTLVVILNDLVHGLGPDCPDCPDCLA
jgi:hypothetical protein